MKSRGLGSRISLQWRRLRYKARLQQYRFSRFRMQFGQALRTGSSVLWAVALVASLLCVVDMLLYFGFDHSPSDLGLLNRGLRAVQAVFAVNVVYNLVLNTADTLRSTRWPKWIVDAGILLTLLPWIYPRPEHPWLPWLDAVLYSRIFLFGALAAYSC